MTARGTSTHSRERRAGVGRSRMAALGAAALAMALAGCGHAVGGVIQVPTTSSGTSTTDAGPTSTAATGPTAPPATTAPPPTSAPATTAPPPKARPLTCPSADLVSAILGDPVSLVAADDGAPGTTCTYGVVVDPRTETGGRVVRVMTLASQPDRPEQGRSAYWVDLGWKLGADERLGRDSFVVRQDGDCIAVARGLSATMSDVFGSTFKPCDEAVGVLLAVADASGRSN